MSLDAKTLRFLRSRSRKELRALFAHVRTHDDRVLLAEIMPAKRRAKRAGDPLVRDLEQTLRPILGSSAEKAELLVAHIAKKHRRKLTIAPKRLTDAARQLRTSFSDQQIRAGAKSLMMQLAKAYGDRETVV